MAISLADNTLTKLPFFSENQVLKASDLNNLVDAVTNQLRLNRIYNVGLGIVDGFRVEWAESDGALVVSRGFGVSSDGYAFDLKGCTYNYVRKIESTLDNYRELAEKCEEYDALMALLKGSGYELRQIDPLEIVPDGWQPLLMAAGTDTLPAGSYCLLYLYREEEIRRTSCFSDCEGQGADQTGTFHAVLVPSGEYVLPPAQEGDGSDSDAVALPEVPSLRAFWFDEKDVKLCKVKDWSTFYTGYRDPCNDVQEKLIEAYGEAQKALQPNGEPLAAELKTTIDKLLGGSVYSVGKEDCTDIQYCYAYFQDLIAAYADLYLLMGGQVKKEIKEDDTNVRCLFPGHLALRGIEVVGDGATLSVSQLEEQEDPCRTARILPDTSIERVSLRDRAIALLNRMRVLVKYENLHLPTWANPTFNEICLTPDVRRFPYLKGRALPFYFKNPTVQEGMATMMDSWRKGAQPNVQAYRYAPNDLEHPLRFSDNGDDWDFYRIEGHLGYPLVDKKLVIGQSREVDNGVHAKVKNLRDCLNLSFDIVAVNLDAPRRGDEAPPIAGSEREAWYKNTRADLLQALWVFSRADLENKVELFRRILKPVDGNIEGALNRTLGACDVVITFLEEYENLFEIRNWLEFEEVNICDPIPNELTSVALNDFVEAYNEFALTMENLRNMDGASDDVLIAILPLLDPALGACIREVAIKERLAREAIWRDTFLAGFARSHPGLVHRGGVEKGGTLVLVYKGMEDDVRILKEVSENFFGKTNEQIVAYLTTGQFNERQLRKKVVVADFSLPYRCCGAGPVHLRQVSLPPLKLTVEEVGCADESTDKEGFPVTITPSEAGGEFVFTAAGRELEFTAPAAPSEEYRLQGFTAADFLPNGTLVVTVEYTLDSRCEVVRFTVLRRPEIGNDPLAFSEVKVVDGTTMVVYDLSLATTYPNDELKFFIGDTEVDEFYDPTLKQLAIPLEVVAESVPLTIQLSNKGCEDRAEVGLCNLLPASVEIKGGCNLGVEGDLCNLVCNAPLTTLNPGDGAFLLTDIMGKYGLIELCPKTPGGTFSVVEVGFSNGDNDNVDNSGLVLTLPPAQREGELPRYHLVVDFDRFSAVTSGDEGVLDCYRQDDGLFSFQSTDKFPEGFLTFITLRYSLGKCENITQTIAIRVASDPGNRNGEDGDGDEIIVREAAPEVLSRSVAPPTPNFTATLNTRRTTRQAKLTTIGEAENLTAEPAFRRAFSYLSVAGDGADPKTGLDATLKALKKLVEKDPAHADFVRKTGEVVATSCLDKLALQKEAAKLTAAENKLIEKLKKGLTEIDVSPKAVFKTWKVSDLYDGADKARLTAIGKKLRE